MLTLFLYPSKMETDLLTLFQDNILKLFSSLCPISEDLANSIRSLSEVVIVKKKEQLLQIGNTSKYIYFITHGALRTYYIDADGSDITSWLLFENELAISVY